MLYVEVVCTYMLHFFLCVENVVMRCKDMHMMVATSKVCEFVGGEDRTNAGSRTEKEPASVYMFKSPHID